MSFFEPNFPSREIQPNPFAGMTAENVSQELDDFLEGALSERRPQTSEQPSTSSQRNISQALIAKLEESTQRLAQLRSAIEHHELAGVTERSPGKKRKQVEMSGVTPKQLAKEFLRTHALTQNLLRVLDEATQNAEHAFGSEVAGEFRKHVETSKRNEADFLEVPKRIAFLRNLKELKFDPKYQVALSRLESECAQFQKLQKIDPFISLENVFNELKQDPEMSFYISGIQQRWNEMGEVHAPPSKRVEVHAPSRPLSSRPRRAA